MQNYEAEKSTKRTITIVEHEKMKPECGSDDDLTTKKKYRIFTCRNKLSRNSYVDKHRHWKSNMYQTHNGPLFQ